MKRLSGVFKLFFLIIILGVTILWATPKIIHSNETPLFVFLSEDPIIWVKDPEGASYRLKSDERFVYRDIFHLLSFSQLGSNGDYYSTLDTGLIQFPKGCFSLLFTEDSHEMERLMAKGQEGSECLVLAAHDCLYNAELWPQVLVTEGPLLQRLKVNIKVFVGFLRGQRVTVKELEKGLVVARSCQPTFRFGFYSKKSGQSYLLSDLPAEEHTWGLQYFPSILAEGDVLHNTSFSSCYEDDYGVLFHVTNPKRLYQENKTIIERFNQIDHHHYVLSLSTSIDAPPIVKEVYFEDTKEMNDLIQKYFQSLNASRKISKGGILFHCARNKGT